MLKISKSSAGMVQGHRGELSGGMNELRQRARIVDTGQWVFGGLLSDFSLLLEI